MERTTERSGRSASIRVGAFPSSACPLFLPSLDLFTWYVWLMATLVMWLLHRLPLFSLAEDPFPPPLPDSAPVLALLPPTPTPSAPLLAPPPLLRSHFLVRPLLAFSCPPAPAPLLRKNRLANFSLNSDDGRLGFCPGGGVGIRSPAFSNVIFRGRGHMYCEQYHRCFCCRSFRLLRRLQETPFFAYGKYVPLCIRPLWYSARQAATV